MSPNYATPGVYIEEITGPGVITGVGTSTAAFIGPAARGPLLTPIVITSFDDFSRAFGRDGDGWPYLVHVGRKFYLAYGVQGFFENGGARAVIVRVGSARATRWSVQNQATTAVDLFLVEAIREGEAGNYTLEISGPPAAGATTPKLAYATADIVSTTGPTVTPPRITVNYAANAPRFVAGDTVQLLRSNNAVGRNRVAGVADSANGPVLTLESPLPSGNLDLVRMAFLDSQQRRVRLERAASEIQAGSLVRLGGGTAHFSVVERVDGDGFVYLQMPFQRSDGTAPPSDIDISSGPTLQSLEFGLRVIGTDGTVLDNQTGLSLDPFHGGYLFRRAFSSVRILPPASPPDTSVLSEWQPATTAPAVVQAGQNDNPSAVSLTDYQNGLKALEDVDDVNMVCAPDAANDATIQGALRDHCLKAHTRDRIAVLDVPFGSEPANGKSALAHRALVQASGGFAALYYPWLSIPEPVEPNLPRPPLPRSLSVPPSGHIAGVYARIDQTLGVHHAPANTEVRGAMGLERILSDREQGLINLEGVNALRIFPGDGRVIVWGARTTAPKTETDWTYVNVRRLMLYIEESIQEGIRWAVFKPNDRPLWQSLKRTIGDFLESVWKAGGLAGATREQAYQVRIDEGLNPPSEIAQGRLHIEIKVAPVRPAEFIIVRIGLWDGGAEVTET
jgi:phage tail sheath protein FI